METRKHRFSTRVGTSSGEAAAPSLDDGPVPEAPEMDSDRLRRYMAGPALLATIPPLAPLREARLNRFPEVFVVVPGHRNAGRRRQVSDPPPTSLSDASNEGEPA